MNIVVVGAGGHARSLIEAIRAGGALEPVACTDPRPKLHGTELDGVPVIGPDSRLEELRADGVEAACLGLGGTRDNEPRARLFEKVVGLGFELPAIVHPTAAVASSATLGDGTVVLALAVVGAGARVGRNVIVNSGALVEHDCALDDHVHVATGAVLGGGVRVGERAHIGLGASVLQDVEVGRLAVVGAGAVVVRHVPEDTVVTGCPATPIRGS